LPSASQRGDTKASSDRAQRLARGLPQRYDSIWSTSFGPLIVVDDQRRYLRLNEAAGRLFGAEPEAIVGKHIEDYSPPENLALLEQMWKELTDRGELRGVYEMLQTDGTRITVEFHAVRDFAQGEHLIAARCLTDALVPAAAGAGRFAPVLSARERQVLQLAADGQSTSEIAQTLILSRGTVKTHFENVYVKLGVSDRVAAVAEAMRRGQIS
jgi:PAS domain S-box-containing protein